MTQQSTHQSTHQSAPESTNQPTLKPIPQSTRVSTHPSTSDAAPESTPGLTRRSLARNIGLLALVVAGLTVAACSSAPTNETKPAGASSVTPALPSTLEEAVASPLRTPENTKRDQYRHPVETLKFFGVAPTMTVVEIQPATGWYTEILAPYLATSGHYIAATAKGKEDAKFKAWVAAHPEAPVQVGDFTLPTSAEMIAPGTADLVITFRNVHNWLSKKNETAAFAAFFKTLKPGGTLGVVEHRADAKSKADADGHNGYVPESLVMNLAKKAGFKFVARSEVNANPKDTKNYKEGVWTLPPTYKLGDQDREKYAAIGESDRMTLKFVKPK